MCAPSCTSDKSCQAAQLHPSQTTAGPGTSTFCTALMPAALWSGGLGGPAARAAGGGAALRSAWRQAHRSGHAPPGAPQCAVQPAAQAACSPLPGDYCLLDAQMSTHTCLKSSPQANAMQAQPIVASAFSGIGCTSRTQPRFCCVQAVEGHATSCLLLPREN